MAIFVATGRADDAVLLVEVSEGRDNTQAPGAPSPGPTIRTNGLGPLISYPKASYAGRRVALATGEPTSETSGAATCGDFTSTSRTAPIHHKGRSPSERTFDLAGRCWTRTNVGDAGRFTVCLATWL